MISQLSLFLNIGTVVNINELKNYKLTGTIKKIPDKNIYFFFMKKHIYRATRLNETEFQIIKMNDNTEEMRNKIWSVCEFADI